MLEVPEGRKEGRKELLHLVRKKFVRACNKHEKEKKIVVKSLSERSLFTRLSMNDGGSFGGSCDSAAHANSEETALALAPPASEVEAAAPAAAAHHLVASSFLAAHASRSSSRSEA